MTIAHPYEEHARLIVCDDEAVWLLARRDHITASAAAAIVGKHPFKTREEVIDTKLFGSDFVPNGRTWFGNAREVANIRIFSKLAGYEVETRLNHSLLVSKEYPWMACTLDGYVVRPASREGVPEELLIELPKLSRGTVVEAKNVQSKSRSMWNKGKMHPRLFMYWAQVQHQLVVTEGIGGNRPGILFAAVDACEMYAHVVTPDVVFQTRLVDEGKKIMDEVEDLRF